MTDDVSRYFDKNARAEWERMDKNLYMHLIWLLHMDFISDLINPSISVLDAGGGSGRYTAELLKLGCDVTLLDISAGELEFAKDMLRDLGLSASAYVHADIRDMAALPDGAFDLTLCYGAPLSYCMDGRDSAISELKRVTKPGGTVAVSVNSVFGILRDQICGGATHFLGAPEYWHVFDVTKSGDCPAFAEIGQPERHFFNAAELKALMQRGGLDKIELGGAPCLSSGTRRTLPDMCADANAFATIKRLELMSYRDPALLGGGEFLLARGQVPR